MNSTRHQLSIIIVFLISSLTVKAQYSKENVETNQNSFSTINGQWMAVNPTNNTLGSNFYQGLNFGFDINNYMSITNPISTNELYFGRWDYSWKGWNRIWHSGNLNNTNADFSAKTLDCSKLLLNIPGSIDQINGLTIDVYSFGTGENALRSSFFKVRDIGASNYIPFIIRGDGNVGVGVANPTVKLDVSGTIRAQEVKVCINQGCDFVFNDDYKLMKLEDLEKFVTTKQHLPEVASEKEMINDGLNMKDFQLKLLQKMEEMTLYVIDLNKKVKSQNQKIKSLELKLKHKK
ncbi:hypothetical protein [Pedobacter jeongneungensis]|uniref:hypothetical protein n=1 Tax=Pedobacter jeongneungensis TaxID=947309 RepID=UPI00046A25B5|nr:hypothetical protein [Pedobacter jeongneungensis]